MKKKIFLALAISIMLVCLFAVGVSAVTGSTSNEYGTVTEVKGMDSLASVYSDHTSRVVLKNADGTFTTYPSYYIYNGNTGSNMRIDMSTLNTALSLGDDEMYTSASVVRVEVFADARLDHLYSGCSSLIDVYLPDGAWLHYASFSGCSSLTTITLPNSCTSIPQSCFYGCTSLETVAFPSTLTSLGAKAFQNCSSLKRADLPSGVTSIPQDCFHGCSNLEYLKVPSSCQTIANYVTNGCSKVVWDLSEATSLQSIGSNNSYGVTTSLVFHDGFKTINGVNSGKITELVFPNSTTSFGVIKCTSLEEFVIPEGVTSLGSKAFDYSTGLKKITIPKGLTSISTTGNTSFFNTRGITEIVYTGNEGDAILTDLLGLLTKATVTYANHCDVYYNSNHNIVTEEGNTCSGICQMCGSMKLLANPIHAEEIVLAFGTGVYVDEVEEKTTDVNYYANMYVLHVCKNCENETADTEEYAPVFVKIGYSAEEEDTTSISFFTSINYASLLKYEEIADTKLQYGLIVSAAASSTPIKNVVDGEIELNASTVKVSMTDTDYAKFSVRISKLPANQTLNCCGYVIENDKVTYLGHESTSAEAEIIDHAGVIELTK